MPKPPLKRNYLLLWLARALTLCSVCYESWGEMRAEDRELKIDKIRSSFPLAIEPRDLSDLYLIWHYTRLLYSLVHSIKPHSRFENRVLTTLLLAEFCTLMWIGNFPNEEKALNSLFILLTLQLEHNFHTASRPRRRHHHSQSKEPEEEEEPRGRSLTRRADLIHLNRRREQLVAQAAGKAS